MRRAERLIRVTQRLLDHPNDAVSLSDLADETGSAKSSLSEDVAIIRRVLTAHGSGVIDTLAGASGGVRFRPRVPEPVRMAFAKRMAERLADPSRLLPGGFLYMSDVLGDPDVLEITGRLFAEPFYDSGVNVVVTMETKGIPLAVAAARCLHVPVVIVRREHRVTDGAALSVHYVSGSERRIQTMSISTRAMPSDARALIVDDFMRAGATVKAVRGLLAEFHAQVVGTAVFVATDQPREKLVDRYLALFRLGTLEEGKRIEVRPAEFLWREGGTPSTAHANEEVIAHE
ncbi:MAG: pur operon repressor [Thermoflavifilum sp.]|nr:pur operon repressor [Thermoflavifilum sp.]MCL6513759.1 pur operon repressor [Alicyclobacillus sp.]